jgi:hypothetical protein
MGGKQTQQSADLRCCASCEFIYSHKEFYKPKGCPVCGFATYGAYYVHGKRAYSYKKSQKPFLDKLVAYQTGKAMAEGKALIAQANQKRRDKFLNMLNIS